MRHPSRQTCLIVIKSVFANVEFVKYTMLHINVTRYNCPLPLTISVKWLKFQETYF